jgi:hypothetical protein
MENESAQKPPPTPAPPPTTTAQTLGTDALTMGASLPFIGPIFAAFGKLSAKGKGIAVLVVLLLVVYPLVSMAMALLIISKSPGSVKKGARDFILSSIGVEDEMMAGVNRSNKVIDASIPRQFTLGSNEDAVQRVTAYQQIVFEAFLRKQHIDGGPECAVEQSAPDESIGKIVVRSLNSDADPYTKSIDPTFGQLFTVGTFGDDQWKRFQESTKSGRPEDQHLLKIKLTENPELAGNAFLKCNKVTVDLYMNIFKPPLVRG